MQDGSFSQYQRHGWALVPLNPGEKAPKQKGWNREALTLTTAEDVRGITHAGLAHAYSGTCCVDIDDLKESVKLMGRIGIDLKALLRAPDAVRITSGRPNRAKLLYRLDTPLPSHKVVTEVAGVKTNIIDFRCATKGGASVQDALPPTIHPGTGKPYRWSYSDALIGHWSNPPALPDELRMFWESRITASATEAEPPDREYPREELEKLITAFDPDTDYATWINVGMALHHATGGSGMGLDVWNEWSAQGAKYEGLGDLTPHWHSFQGDGITVDYLYMHQSASADDFEDVSDEDAAADPDAHDGKDTQRFKPVLVGEWVQRPPPRWLVEDVLPESDLAMVFGASGSGKSFFVLDMALHIATGAQWREKETVQGPVVWIAAEAAGSVRNRALAFAKHNDVDLSAAPLWIIGETPSLADVDHVRQIATHTRSIAPVVIVVDTLAAASGGGNENSGEDMGLVLAACRSLHKITGALILLIHHAGKDASKGARGWSGLKAAMQTEIEVTLGATGDRNARIAKQRDAEENIDFAFKLLPVTLTPFDDKPQRSCVVEPVEGVLIVDEIPHGGMIAAGLDVFFASGKTSVSYEEFDKALAKASRAAGEDPVHVAGELAQVAKVLIDAGYMLDVDGEYTLLNLPTPVPPSDGFETEVEFD